jgi:hypothetical protein
MELTFSWEKEIINTSVRVDKKSECTGWSGGKKEAS